MAQIMQCDRCGSLDRDVVPATANGTHVDLCVLPDGGGCFGEVFDGEWFTAARERVSNVPALPRPTVQRPFPRPPRHGFTAEAIEAAQAPGGDPPAASGDPQ